MNLTAELAETAEPGNLGVLGGLCGDRFHGSSYRWNRGATAVVTGVPASQNQQRSGSPSCSIKRVPVLRLQVAARTIMSRYNFSC